MRILLNTEQARQLDEAIKFLQDDLKLHTFGAGPRLSTKERFVEKVLKLVNSDNFKFDDDAEFERGMDRMGGIR